MVKIRACPYFCEICGECAKKCKMEEHETKCAKCTQRNSEWDDFIEKINTFKMDDIRKIAATIDIDGRSRKNKKELINSIIGEINTLLRNHMTLAQFKTMHNLHLHS
jgi:F0F1-type ATP synthase delta subunit